jgi:hypothetical protein
MEHAIAHFFQSLVSVRGFTNFGWTVMRVITISTLAAITIRLLPRRTR